MTASSAERDLLRQVDAALGERRAAVPVARTTVGERLVAVELDGPETGMGVAHRPPGDTDLRPPETAGDLSRWAFEPPADDPVAASLGIAALNARSVGAIDWTSGDPMAMLDPGVNRIATVGLFRAAFRKFDDVEVRVIEREPVGDLDPPDGVSVRVFGPEGAAAALDDIDLLFVTGSALLYGGLLRYLRLAADGPTVVMIGATASFLPGPVFEAGVDLLAGASVTDPDRVRTGIEGGCCGTDLHGEGLQKVFVADGSSPTELALAD